MIEKHGDIWQCLRYPETYCAICITTNGVVKTDGSLVMGGGIALEAKKKFPDIDNKLGSLVSKLGNKPFVCYKTDNGISILSFPTKEHYREASSLDLITRSAQAVVSYLNVFDVAKKIAIPRPGCGLGGLNWSEVKPKISRILDNRFEIWSW